MRIFHQKNLYAKVLKSLVGDNRRLFILTFVWLAHHCLFAQTSSMTLGDKTIQGQQVKKEAWLFQDEEDTIIAVTFEAYNDLVEEIKQLKADTNRLNAIITAKNELIERHKDYEVTADEHIDVQRRLIQTADSLYVGYKSLYGDLKKIYGLNTLSVIPGLGFYSLPDRSERVFGSVGIAYKKTQGHIQFGRNYTGVLLGFRLPVF